jgi:hypothetical protein
LKLTRSTHLAAADPAVSSPPPGTSVAGGWGNAGSRCVNSVGLARSSAGGVGRAVALPVVCFAGGDLPLRRRRSGGAPKWICCLRRARSSGQLPWATSPRRRSRTTASAFQDPDSELKQACDVAGGVGWRLFGVRVPTTSRPPGDICRSKDYVAMRRRCTVGAFYFSSVASLYRRRAWL